MHHIFYIFFFRLFPFCSYILCSNKNESEHEVVKRSGRDESVWAIIHTCMEAVLGIFLYRNLYLKLAKILCFSYCLLYFLFNKIGEQESRTGSAWKWWELRGVGRAQGAGCGGRGEWLGRTGRRGGPNNVYTYE
jgi:hypothetical protein